MYAYNIRVVRTPGANLGERDAPRFLICVRRSGDGERDVEVCPSEEQAGDEAGTRDQRREDAHVLWPSTGEGFCGYESLAMSRAWLLAEAEK